MACWILPSAIQKKKHVHTLRQQQQVAATRACNHPTKVAVPSVRTNNHIITNAYRSELACCDKSDYGYYGNEYYEGGNDDSVSFEYAANVGTCTWDADVYTEGIELENGAVKLGTAWATCKHGSLGIT